MPQQQENGRNDNGDNENDNDNDDTIDYASYGIDNDNGWFTETDPTWPGQRFSLALAGFDAASAVVHASQSEFQSILVFQSAQYGHVLVLDGA